MANIETAVLDIGSSKITVVIGTRGVNNTFNIRGWGECDYDGFSERKFYDQSGLRTAFSHAINVAETNAKTKIEKLYVGIPGDFCDCFVKDVSIALKYRHKITNDDVSGLFRQGSYSFAKEAMNEKVIAVAPVYFMTDDNRRIINPVGTISSKLSGCISYIFAEAAFLQTLANTLKDIGIPETEFLPSVLAEALYLFEPEKRDGSVILLDIGHITTNIIFARGDGILGLKTLPTGGGHITAALYAVFEPEDYAIAEALKKKIVLSLNTAEQDVYEVVYKAETYRFNARTANETVKEYVEGLAQLIKTELNAFDKQYPDYLDFHLTGGGLSYIRGAKEILSKALSRPVELVMPEVPQLDKPTLSSILGLLDDAIEKNSAEAVKEGFLQRLKRRLTGK